MKKSNADRAISTSDEARAPVKKSATVFRAKLLSEPERCELAKSQVAEVVQQAIEATQSVGATAALHTPQNQREATDGDVNDLDNDARIAGKNSKNECLNAPVCRPETEWSELADGNALLNEIHMTVKRFIICSNETAITATLWIAFTWFIYDVDVAPLAVISSPEKRCGKSQLLDLIGRLSRKPLVASNISPAAIYRVIDDHCPTLLIDEADSFLKNNEALRGIINSGHTRQSAYVIRTVGQYHTPTKFSTWGAKAIAGIGSLSDTLMDRAVHLQLRRKSPSEVVERLRYAEFGLFERLASMLSQFADDAAPAIRQARPQLPEALDDRQRDNWEPLLAIADHAGGDWPRVAREAALKISGRGLDAESLSLQLLADIQMVFKNKSVGRITSAELVEALCEDKQRPWATFDHGHRISYRQLAKLLKKYGIGPESMRLNKYDTFKGYLRSSFKGEFSCYLNRAHATPDSSSGAAQSSDELDAEDDPTEPDISTSAGTETLSGTRKPLPSQGCYGVTDKSSVGRGKYVEVEI